MRHETPFPFRTLNLLPAPHAVRCSSENETRLRRTGAVPLSQSPLATRAADGGEVKPYYQDANLDVVAEAWPLALALLKDDRHWYAFASPRRISEAERIFANAKHILSWDKGDRGTVGDLECGFGEAWEAIFYGMKGRRALRGSRPRTVIRHDWSSTMDPVHPTVKPIVLLQRMIQWSTDEGESVLDPFCGSGTTLFAAKQLGRKSVGIELDEKYCEIAAQRCSQETLNLGVA